MIHHVFANKSNIGDWLSARGIQSLLAEQAHGTASQASSADGGDVPPSFGGLVLREHLCDEPFVEQTLDELRSAGPTDLIVIGGGGLFMDYFLPFWEGFRELAVGRPFVIWGVGFCDLKHEPSRPPMRLLEEILACSRLCMVRDELTRQHLPGCSLPDPVPCPSLCAVNKPPHPGWGLLHVDNYTTAGADAYEAMDAYGREFARQTGRPFLRTNNRIEPGREASLAEHLERYAAADLVLSSALHGCILAAGMGRRVVAVSGDCKIESFMAAAGLSDWVCDTGEVGRVPQMLNSLANQPPVNDFVARAAAANRAVAQRVLAGGRSH